MIRDDIENRLAELEALADDAIANNTLLESDLLSGFFMPFYLPHVVVRQYDNFFSCNAEDLKNQIRQLRERNKPL